MTPPGLQIRVRAGMRASVLVMIPPPAVRSLPAVRFLPQRAPSGPSFLLPGHLGGSRAAADAGRGPGASILEAWPRILLTAVSEQVRVLEVELAGIHVSVRRCRRPGRPRCP